MTTMANDNLLGFQIRDVLEAGGMTFPLLVAQLRETDPDVSAAEVSERLHELRSAGEVFAGEQDGVEVWALAP